VRAIFLDRDGVINENRDGYVKVLSEFRFLPGALEALALLAKTPFAVVVVTNQSAVGREQMTGATLTVIHDWMLARVRDTGGRIDAVYTCPHRPEDACCCRKPQPHLLHQAAWEKGIDLRSSVFVGDSVSDLQAARAAGCDFILVLTGKGLEAYAELVRAGDLNCGVAATLMEAVGEILTRERSKAVGQAKLGPTS
jgi:D-glycero-D-manno-heptose 1,7-bisphosphate phosphatase